MTEIRKSEEGLRNIQLIVEYDGTGLSGWQRQKNRPTIQGHLETALSRLAGETIQVNGAGRTDAGVHAYGQSANFRTACRLPLEAFRKGGNALLPGQIAIRSVRERSLNFHARFDARGKIYDYELLTAPVRSPLVRAYAWHISARLDLAEMNRALRCIVGRHCFAAFQSTGSPVRDTRRHVRAVGLREWNDGRIRLSIEADGFLRHMVRALVGTVVQVGQGRFSAGDFEEILKSGDRSRAGPTAPARGLFLRQVNYDPVQVTE